MLRRVAAWASRLLLFGAPTRAQGYLCAKGGGNANRGAWADEVFGWIVERAAEALWSHRRVGR